MEWRSLYSNYNFYQGFDFDNVNNQETTIDVGNRQLVDVPIRPENDVPIRPENDVPKARLRWSGELHASFLQAVDELGGAENATPKTIRDKMGIDGLTLHHVKSHLQKFRQTLKSARSLNRPEIIQDIESDMRFPVNEPVRDQVGTEKDDIYLLPLMAFSPVDNILNHFDQSGDCETENPLTGSRPVQAQPISNEEETCELPPINPSSTEDYQKDFAESDDWAMEYLLANEMFRV